MEDNRIAIVTEAGNGLGKSFANILYRHKYNVIIAASSESFAIMNQDRVLSQKFKLINVDLKSVEELSELKSYVDSKYGHLDVLVNNAEIANGFGQKIDQIILDDVKELYEINFFSVLKMIQLFKPLLEKSQLPRIINITSAMGSISKMEDNNFCYTDYCMTAYATSKAALDMYTHLQRKEFKTSKIKINNFDPILPQNCSYNSVKLCGSVEDQFLSLIYGEKEWGL